MPQKPMNEIGTLLNQEWLEADGCGGFASGTVSGIRTRRYHALLLTATSPPTGRMVLVNGLEAWVETVTGVTYLTSQHYEPDVIHPDGCRWIVQFTAEPWPTWVFDVGDGARMRQEILVSKRSGETVIRWGAEGKTMPRGRLCVRLLLSGRDYHALHRENSGFRFDAESGNGHLTWRPYTGVPGVQVLHNGHYDHGPLWYRNFLYLAERDRGLDCVEDLASPGTFAWNLQGVDAVLVLRAAMENRPFSDDDRSAMTYARKLIEVERARRARLASSLDRAADAYIVQRSAGKTIVAGYPWFTDWGRDTFIALRGLCLARGELSIARDILLEWATTISEGMLPNRFPDGAGEPEYNSVDASLWYVVAVHEFLEAVAQKSDILSNEDRGSLQKACLAIVSGYARGTRFGIRMDDDGLLSAGVPGAQLTWMDAKIGDWVVTPRIGKPVEVQALWINALWIVSNWVAEWRAALRKARYSFARRFWNEAKECLYDVIDVDHVQGRMDDAIRPNQVFAVGGLPFRLLSADQSRSVMNVLERELWTPLGLRSLAPSEPGYRGRYEGGVWDRDSAYHQGTVWPWLIGAFVEGWLRAHGDSPAKRREVHRRFIAPLETHVDEAGLGHVSEIADAEFPHTPRGCPFQAWSVGELIHARQRVGAVTAAPAAHQNREAVKT